MLRPLEGFSLPVFRSRRERVLSELGESAMVLPSASVRYSSRDTEYPYRPDSELFYVTGVAEPDAVAVLLGHADGARFVLFVRPRDAEAERWSGKRPGPEEAAELYGADETYSINELEDRLPGLLAGSDMVHLRLGHSPRVERLVRQALETARRRGARKGEGPRGVMDPGTILDEMRLIKETGEIMRLRQAAMITAEAHLDAIAGCRPDMGEYELEAILDGTFRRLGADGPGYGTIVGAGANGCVLHYVENTHTIERGELVLVDAGAAVGLYSADITRTFPASGRFKPEQRAVYDIVNKARQAAIDAVRPGATIANVHDSAVQVIVEGLIAEGVLGGSVEERISEGDYKPYYPHQTSHWLGLDVHDVGDYAREGRSRVLEPGMVFTVEPGLYFGKEVEGAAARFACIGVRIEDDVVVTERGCDVLTKAVPTDPERLAELVGSKGG